MARFARMWVLGAGLGLVASLGGGCPADAKTCISDEDCDEGGQCEPVGACSMPDEECETGRRYNDDAPSGRGGQCVEGFGTTTGAVPPPYEEPDEESDDGSEGGSSGGPECPTITPGADFVFAGSGQYYDQTVMPPLGDPALPDIMWLEVFDTVSGTFVLDSDYLNCQHCILVIVDDDTQFIAVEGEMEVDVPDVVGEPAVIGLSGVRLAEAEVDLDTREATLVEDGACVTVEDVESIAVDWWTCDPGFFGLDGDCDCGCGVADPDCEGQSSTWCDFCDEGSCSGFDCDTIDPADNSICYEPVWNCPEDLLGDGSVCHCGCGLVDPDCVSTAVGSCDVCDAPGSCVPPDANGECVGQIHPDRNWQCTPVPGWTCAVTSYGDTLCDCGCGAVDIDCDPEQPCEVCNSPGSCSMDPCPGMIDPMDTTTCLPMG